jgi:hypothetical protein
MGAAFLVKVRDATDWRDGGKSRTICGAWPSEVKLASHAFLAQAEPTRGRQRGKGPAVLDETREVGSDALERFENRQVNGFDLIPPLR